MNVNGARTFQPKKNAMLIIIITITKSVQGILTRCRIAYRAVIEDELYILLRTP